MSETGQWAVIVTNLDTAIVLGPYPDTGTAERVAAVVDAWGLQDAFTQVAPIVGSIEEMEEALQFPGPAAED